MPFNYTVPFNYIYPLPSLRVMLHLLPPLPLDFRLLFEGGRFLALLLRPPLRIEGDRFIVDGEAVWKSRTKTSPSPPQKKIVMGMRERTPALVAVTATIPHCLH